MQLVVLKRYAVSDEKRINGIQDCTHISSLLMYELKTLTPVIWNFSPYDLQIYPISVFILKFPLHHWTFSLSPLRFQNCFPVPSRLAWRSASCVHREVWEGEWDGVEKWICIFICIEAPADLRTVRIASFMAVKPTEWLASWLGNWSDWLIHLTDKLLTAAAALVDVISSCPAEPSNLALLLTECLTFPLADSTDRKTGALSLSLTSLTK